MSDWDFFFVGLAIWVPVLWLVLLIIVDSLEAPVRGRVRRLLVGARPLDEADISGARPIDEADISEGGRSVSGTGPAGEGLSEDQVGWRVKMYLTHQRAYDCLVDILYVVDGLLLLAWPWIVVGKDIGFKIGMTFALLLFSPFGNIRDWLMLYRYPTIESRVAHEVQEEWKVQEEWTEEGDDGEWTDSGESSGPPLC